MIGRLLVALAGALTLLAAAVTAGLLEVDLQRGRDIYVPIEVWDLEGDLVSFQASGPFEELWRTDDFSAKTGEPVHTAATRHVAIDVDAAGRVVGTRWVPVRPAGLHVRARHHGSLLPTSTRAPLTDADQARYAWIRVSPSGEGYLMGLVDEELQVIGRGGQLW